MSNTIDQLNGTGQRTKTHDAQLVVKVPKAAKALIEKAAVAQGVSAATVVRHAVAEYLERRGYNRS